MSGSLKEREMTWFENLFGFEELSSEEVHKNIVIEGDRLKSLINGASYQYGSLKLAALKDLRQQVSLSAYKDQLRISELVGNTQLHHAAIENENAVFQAASQFNLLEMIHPGVSPDDGVSCYENDHTQGPACAIACGAGTIYRNYFVPIDGEVGQTASRQIDCLEGIAKYFEQNGLALWQMKNGYVLASEGCLIGISKHLSQLSEDELENLKGKLKIGVQQDTEVTISETGHLVTQVYCSALPVAYSSVESEYWKAFASLTLQASYEATMYVALSNFERTGVDKVFLTLVGGGAFGNENSWIKEAILKVMAKFKNIPLDVKLVSYGRSNALVREVIEEFEVRQ